MTEVPIPESEFSYRVIPSIDLVSISRADMSGGILKKAATFSVDRIVSVDSADSVVGRLDQYAIKRSNRTFSSDEEANAALTYLDKTVQLFETFMPPNVPKTRAFAAEVSNERRVFVVQDWITGVKVNALTEEEKHDPILLSRYDDFYKKLYTIYRAEHDVNRYIPQTERFELSRVQPIGNRADARLLKPNNMVDSKNLLVDRHDKEVYIFDFGAWSLWVPAMQKSYDKIMESVSRKFQKHIPFTK